jgi:protein phosphatase/serine/threonine-protein phosphatase Stp1
MIRFRSWAVSHSGAVRDHNEDSFVDRPEIGLWAVADGAGGHNSGEVASAMIKQALERIQAGLSASEMIAEVRAGIANAHNALLAEAARRGPQIMIASTVAVLLAHEDHYACLWAGDSRIYLLREAELRQLTRDHSLVQEMVDAGVVRPENAESHPRANVITRAVGAEGDPFELEKIVGGILPGDRFLLCSDGLFKALPVADVASLLDPAEISPAEALIEAALRARATDNVTAVVVEALAEIGDSTVGV